MTDSTDLIARLEAAEGPDRGLDAEIARLKGYEVHDKLWVRVTSYDGHEKGALSPLPHYTASIDAALTLVPEGWGWSFGQTPTDEGVEYHAQVNWEPIVAGGTPAIALCIAALKAREAG